MYRHYIKRGLDFFLALVGIIVLSWLFLLLFVFIKAESKGTVFFRQTRIGKDKKTFEILKFRTMRTETPKDVPTHLLENPEQYITRIGKFLRKTSLDELPQMFNILKGDMAVIGPRPALWNQYDLMELRDACGANDVRPGLTGYAQISGRDELPIDVKAKLDGEYVQRMNFWFDVKIFFLTIWKVIYRDGVHEGVNQNSKEKEQISG